MFFAVDHHAVQSIIIEDSVVDTFRCRTLVIDLFISVRTAGNRCVKPDVPIRFCLNDTSILRRRAAVFAFDSVVFSKGAAPHKIVLRSVIAIGEHAEPFLTDGRAVFIDLDGIRNRFWTAAVMVKIDKSPDIAVLKQRVGRKIIHSGIKAHVCDCKGGHMFFQFMESG